MATFTSEGFLENFLDWQETLARELASKENLALTEQHWQIIQFVRDFYTQYQYSPIQRLIVKQMQSLQADFSSIDLQTLFPKGPRQICLIAGLPKPARCV